MPQPRVTTLTLDHIDNYLSTMCERGRSAHTIKAYGADLRMFLLDQGAVEIPMEIYESLAMSWLTKYRKILKPRTTNRRLTSLRSYARWARWNMLLDDYSPPNPGPSIPHPLPEGMSGVRRMIQAAAEERHRTLIVLCGLLGLRVSEALSVVGTDFNVGEQKVTVRGKGDKTRTIPVSNEALNHLVTPIMRSLVSGESIVPLDDRLARRYITRIGIEAGLMRRVASHDLRSTFATELYERTKDQRLVQIILGHASGKTTEGYIAVQMNQLKAGVEKL